MYPFFESIAVEHGRRLNLSYHQERIHKTFSKYYLGFQTHDIEQILEKENKFIFGKLKFHYNHQNYALEYKSHNKKVWQNFYIREMDYLVYNYKFSDRLFFDWIKKMHSTDEEIIFTKNGFITDCSYANIAFLKDDYYITPNDALLQGTMRNKLISEGKLLVKNIHKNELSEFAGFKLINSMNDLQHSHYYPIDCIQEKNK